MKIHPSHFKSGCPEGGAINCGIPFMGANLRFLCAIIIALGLISEAHSAVIYRNNFGNSGASYISNSAVNWQTLGANNSASNVGNFSTTAIASLGISPETGVPTNLSNVNAGSSQSNTDGFSIIGSGILALNYGSYTIDRTTTHIDSIQWYGAEYRGSAGATHGAVRVAIQIGSQWYVSQATSLTGSAIPTGQYSTGVAQQQQFINYASLYTIDFASATWYTLTANIGSPFSISSSSVSLPGTGNITSVGFYGASPSSGSMYVDTFTINASTVPEPGASAMFLMGGGIFFSIMLIKRTRKNISFR